MSVFCLKRWLLDDSEECVHHHFPICCYQGMNDLQVRAAATDIFSYLVEFSPSMVREFVMQEPQQTDDVSLDSSVTSKLCFEFNLYPQWYWFINVLIFESVVLFLLLYCSTKEINQVGFKLDNMKPYFWSVISN